MHYYLSCIRGKEAQPWLVLAVSPVEGETESTLTSNFSLHLRPPKSTSARREKSWVSDFVELQNLPLRETDHSVALCETPCTRTIQYIANNHLEWSKFQTATHCVAFNLCFPRQLRFVQMHLDWLENFFMNQKGQKKKREKKIALHFPLLLAGFVIWATKFFHQIGCRSVFSEDEVDIDTHTLTKYQPSASVNCSVLFPPVFFGEGVPSPHWCKQRCSWDNRFRLRWIENFSMNYHIRKMC